MASATGAHRVPELVLGPRASDLGCDSPGAVAGLDRSDHFVAFDDGDVVGEAVGYVELVVGPGEPPGAGADGDLFDEAVVLDDGYGVAAAGGYVELVAALDEADGVVVFRELDFGDDFVVGG